LDDVIVVVAIGVVAVGVVVVGVITTRRHLKGFSMGE
jgi:hypothetical protein